MAHGYRIYHCKVFGMLLKDAWTESLPFPKIYADTCLIRDGLTFFIQSTFSSLPSLHRSSPPPGQASNERMCNECLMSGSFNFSA